MSPKIEGLQGYPRLGSRGIYTVMAEIRIGDLVSGAMVPSGASKGEKEATELPVATAIRNIEQISRAIVDIDIFDQERIDQTMIDLDGTETKSKLGANAILAVSMAVARAAAEYCRQPLFKYLAEIYGEDKPTLLPTPMPNVINGGVHAKNDLHFQEFMIVPAGASSFAQAVDMASEVYLELKDRIDASGVGDEGGFSPQSFKTSNERDRIFEIMDILMEAIKEANYVPGQDFFIALDPAASEFYKNGEYDLSTDNERMKATYSFLVELFSHLSQRYPLISIEDGIAQNDETGWKKLTQKLGRRLQIVGDDLFVTNPKIFARGIEEKIANAILVKPNQIGTLTETLRVIRMAKEAGYNTIISHRSGETEDTFIADLAVATRAGQIKTGAPARGERTAKYNRFLDIEQRELPRLGLTSEYAGLAPYIR